MPEIRKMVAEMRRQQEVKVSQRGPYWRETWAKSWSVSLGPLESGTYGKFKKGEG